MNQDVISALLIMLIGMITVFVILSIVVISGRLLIRIVNRYTPDEIPASSIIPEHVAVITSVVSDLTNGEARHIKIEKQ